MGEASNDDITNFGDSNPVSAFFSGAFYTIFIELALLILGIESVFQLTE